MAQYAFSKDIAEARNMMAMDGPLQSSNQIKFQRKKSEASAKTPGKSGSSTAVTPGKPKTPKTPGAVGGIDLLKKAPKSGKKTPGRAQDDRFIPNRAMTDMDYGHYAVMKEARGSDDQGDNLRQDNQENVEYQERLKDCLDVRDRKILNFRQKPPEPKRLLLFDSANSNLNILYTGAKSSGVKKEASRHIPQEPDRVLDAPDLMDDYYLNLLDWSKSNIFAVALGSAVFLWNADSGSITQLCELQEPEAYFSSVAWVEEGDVLASGTSAGVTQLWDTTQQKLLRSMAGHVARVGSLAWNQHLLASGSRTGAIHLHDVRTQQHQVASLQQHSQEVCGLRWAPGGGHLLASGANDNTVNIWSNRAGSSPPVHSFTAHQAAVKALAWCPWQPHILASGGGTSDRCIKLWNTNSGASLSSTDTGSQVCSILWSAEHKELISGHGFSLNHLRIWKYPTMTRVTDLVGHSQRVLCMAMSPDGQTVASAAADETIRLWKCFQAKPATEKKKAERTIDTAGLRNMCIR